MPSIPPPVQVHSLLGSALKDAPEDRKKLHHYFNNAVRDRRQGLWPDYYEARRHLL